MQLHLHNGAAVTNLKFTYLPLKLKGLAKRRELGNVPVGTILHALKFISYMVGKNKK